MEKYRAKLDKIDDRIIRLLTDRFEICQKIGVFKKRYGIKPLNNKERYRKKFIYMKGLGEFGEIIYKQIHSESIKKQK